MKEKTHAFGGIVRMALVLLAVTAVVAALLAGVNAVTRERILQAKAEKLRAAIASVLPDADTAQPVESFRDDSGKVTAVYASDGGYAIEVCPAGFGGTIDLMVGVSRDGKVLGVAVISHTETPGLGAVAAAQNAAGKAFRAQFSGQSGTLAVKKDGGGIDALTGATVTSRAITAGINAALACAVGLE